MREYFKKSLTNMKYSVIIYLGDMPQILILKRNNPMNRTRLEAIVEEACKMASTVGMTNLRSWDGAALGAIAGALIQGALKDLKVEEALCEELPKPKKEANA